MRIGPYELDSNLFLSPLAGYTNLPFRLTVREIGGVDWTTTDLVNARSLLEKNKRALQMVSTCPAEKRLAVQLFGAVPEEMRDAAAMVESMGIASVDINMGCPVKKVTGIGGGSAMMTELGKTAKLVRGMIDAVKIPITAKMRLGWDENNLTAPDLARVLEDTGVSAIFVHGRTRAQGFSGTVNLAGIRAVVQAVTRIPVIGNGDVTTPEAAQHMINETGCAGVSIGRGAFYNPWIFRDTQHYLRTGELRPEAGYAERVTVMRRHLELMIGFYGEDFGCRLFRKPAAWYAKRFGPAKEFKKGITQFATRAEFEALLTAYEKWRQPFLDEHGELQARYRPGAMVATFMLDPDDPAVLRRESIPVPKGPVDVW